MILDDIVEKKKVRVENAKKIVAPEDMYKLALEASSLKDNRISFKEALKKEGLSVIGEFKKASPAKGVIRSNFNIEEIYKERKGLEQRYMELVEGGIR